VTPEHRLLLRQLADALLQEKAQILDEWVRAVHEERRIQSSEQVSRTALVDHLPKLLDTVGELLRFESGEKSEVIGEDARKHGSYRWEQGYNLDEVVRELMIFRSVMIRHVISMESKHGPVPQEVRLVMMERLHRLLDELGWRSTLQFVHEQQRSLVRANEARARLIRNVSHELRNVLNGLSLASELIEDVDAEPVREMRDTLFRNVDHMRELLDDLLDLSALVNGQQLVRATGFVPTTLLNEVEAIYRPMAEAKSLAFHAECDPRLASVIGDQRKIQQIIANLLSNAIKYTDRGEIRVAFTPADDTLWSIAVTDTGAGISAEDQKEIFSEFYRVEATSNVRGVGLGLAITCRLVELLGGELRLTSELNRGSRFEVLLPLKYEKRSLPPDKSAVGAS